MRPDLSSILSVCSLLFCATYNQFRCCDCFRDGESPGYVMLPFSFGVALLVQHVLSIVLVCFPFVITLVVQIFLGLVAQIYSTQLWIEADEFVLETLYNLDLTEEEVMSYWWYIMVIGGSLLVLAAMEVTNGSKGCIHFNEGHRMKHCTCLLYCAAYNPFQSCKYCRGGLPPGYVMLPYSFGVALLAQHVLSICLVNFPFIPSLVVQIFLGLAAQNYSTYIWIEADEFILKTLTSLDLTEEEVLYYWWYLMVFGGSLLALASMVVSTCSRGHICFNTGIRVKPWTCYWKRLTNKRVNFLHSVAIIPQAYK